MFVEVFRADVQLPFSNCQRLKTWSPRSLVLVAWVYTYPKPNTEETVSPPSKEQDFLEYQHTLLLLSRHA